jgi:hypothetical protein
MGFQMAFTGEDRRVTMLRMKLLVNIVKSTCTCHKLRLTECILGLWVGNWRATIVCIILETYAGSIHQRGRNIQLQDIYRYLAVTVTRF